MAVRAPIILYFVNGRKPSAEDEAMIRELGRGVRVRNAKMIGDDDALEKADGVAGPAIPAAYKAAYQTVGGQQAMAGNLARGARPPSVAAVGVPTDATPAFQQAVVPIPNETPAGNTGGVVFSTSPQPASHGRKRR